MAVAFFSHAAVAPAQTGVEARTAQQQPYSLDPVEARGVAIVNRSGKSHSVDTCVTCVRARRIQSTHVSPV
eukprot:349608-Chlamydomonas_euryale.AAC.2